MELFTPTSIAFTMGCLTGTVILAAWERGYIKTAVAALALLPLLSTILENAAK